MSQQKVYYKTQVRKHVDDMHEKGIQVKMPNKKKKIKYNTASLKASILRVHDIREYTQSDYNKLIVERRIKRRISEILAHLDALSQPKQCTPKFTNSDIAQNHTKWKPPSLKTALTTRQLELSQPRYVARQSDVILGTVPPQALLYEATERIKMLAIPRDRFDPMPDVVEEAFKVSKNALKYEPSQRIVELAQPKKKPRRRFVKR